MRIERGHAALPGLQSSAYSSGHKPQVQGVSVSGGTARKAPLAALLAALRGEVIEPKRAAACEGERASLFFTEQSIR